MKRKPKNICSTWVFRVEVASDKTALTKDIKAELLKLLFESKLIGNWFLEEDYTASAYHILDRKKEAVVHG